MSTKREPPSDGTGAVIGAASGTPSGTPSVVRIELRAEEVRCPGPRLEGVRRLVVIRADRLGDLVLTLPAVDALRRAYPRARLALAVRRAWVDLARTVGGVDQVLEAPPDAGELAACLERFGPDLAVCVSREAAVAAAVVRAGVPHRVGTARRWFAYRFNRRVREPRRHGSRHEAEFALSYAHRVGAPAGPARFPIELPDEARARAAARLGTRGPRVVVHPGSGGSCPAWPAERHLELAARLASEGVSVLLSIGPADHSVEAARDTAPPDAKALAVARGSLLELAATLEAADLVISNSTGPIHLAAAVGTPALGVYAPWPTCGPGRWGPYSERGLAIVAAAPGVEAWSRRRRRLHAARVMRTVSVDFVARVALGMLAGRPPETQSPGL